ncbi:MAG: thiamine phosphate synthase [bacterium]
MFPKNYFQQPRLCLITDRKIVRAIHESPLQNLTDAVKEAVDAGVDMVQLREKDLPSKEYFELARQTKIICERRSALLIINDRIDIALAVDADGVHLGWQSLPFHIARHLLGKEKIIGVSTHSKDEAVLAEEKGADYITIPPNYLGEYMNSPLQIPVFAVGGINENNAGEIIKAGANGIAVISAILRAEDVKGTVSKIRQSIL